MSRRDASYASGPQVTGSDRKAAGLTGMTDRLPLMPLTHDGFLQFDGLYAGAGEGETGPSAHRSSSSAKTWRRPPWLYDGPLTDRARLRSCNRCRRPILEALADTVMPARVDLVRLSPHQELQHLVAGGMTLRLVPDIPSPWIPARLCFRWLEQIRAHPGRGVPVHQCDVVWGDVDRSLIRTAHRPTFTTDPTF